MLKIKDDVDLKELEKFGFKKNNNEYTRSYYDSDLDADEIIIREDKMIKNFTCLETYDDSYLGENNLSNDLEFKICDLIQAGLVEKVEEINKCYNFY